MFLCLTHISPITDILTVFFSVASLSFFCKSLLFCKQSKTCKLAPILSFYFKYFDVTTVLLPCVSRIVIYQTVRNKVTAPFLGKGPCMFSKKLMKSTFKINKSNTNADTDSL